MQIGLIYTSIDGHESISLSQYPAGGANPDRELGDGEGWETVRGRPAPRQAAGLAAVSRSHVAAVSPRSRSTALRTLPFSVSGSSETNST